MAADESDRQHDRGREPWEDVEPAVESGLQPMAQPPGTPGKPAGLRTDLPVWRIVLGLAIWPLIEQLMNALVWFVDSALAGHLAPDQVKQASEAIGAAVYFMWLMGLLQGAVGVGSTALVARFIGSGDRDAAARAVGQSITLALVWGLLSGVLFYVIAEPVGHWLNLEAQSIPMAADYMRLLALVAPLRAVLFIGAACLRGAGDTRSPFFVMAAVTIVNIIVSVALVADFSPIGGHGVRGIALGTMIAWLVGGLAMAGLLVRGRGGVALHLHRMRFDWPMSRRLIRIGLPALFEHGGHWLGNFVIIMMVGHLARLGLEEYPLGAHNFGIRIEGFSFLPGFAFAMAAATVAGQYLGARDAATARRAIGWAWGYGGGVMVAFGILFITIPETLVRTVTDEPQFLAVTPQLLFLAGWAQIGFATALVLSGALRGAGDTRACMIITFTSTFCIRLPLAWIIGVEMEYGLVGIWAALTAELLIRGLLFALRFFHGGWTKVSV